MGARIYDPQHVESRAVDVWWLQVKVPGAPGLKVSTGENNRWTGMAYGAEILNHRVSDWTGWLESVFGRPVINRTGLTGRYDIDLKWKPAPGQSAADALRQALLDQLGLELIPAREQIRMLVVDQAKVN